MLPEVARLEQLTVMKALLEASVNKMDELCPFAEDLVFKTLRQELFSFKGYIVVLKLTQNLVLNLLHSQLVKEISLGLFQVSYVVKQSLLLSESQRHILNSFRI